MNAANPSLLVISGVRGDTRRYRTFHLYEQARLAGLECQLAHITDSNLLERVATASMLILHRAPFTPLVAELSRRIHRKGGMLIQDIDDLLFEAGMFKFIDSPDFADPLRAELYQEEMHMYRQTVEACDAVFASTEYLAQRIQSVNKPARVHRNAFSMEMLDLSQKAITSRSELAKRLVIGYASGTATHNLDFALVKPALVSILRRHAHTELWLVGPLDPGKDWGSLVDRVKIIQKVPWRNLPSIQAQFDINLAPIRVDNPFGQSKSEIKYVESALVKVPTIASPSDAYQYAIRNNVNGMLAETTQQWETNIDKLIQEPQFRRELGQAAYQDSLQRYHPLVRAKELIAALGSLSGTDIPVRKLDGEINPKAGDTHQSYWNCVQLEKSPSLLQMGLYTFRQRGILTLIKQVRVYLRRSLAPIFPYRNRQ